MKQEKAYKIKLVKILEILRQDSDEDNYITTGAILKRLADMNIICDRRTLYTDIGVLNDFGYEVLCEKERGLANKYCIINRDFEIPELKILIDAVQASSFIPQDKTNKLIDKIADLGGSRRSELMKNSLVQYNVTKHSNEQIYYIVQQIEEAIENNKKISFYYFDYNVKKEKVFRKKKERYNKYDESAINQMNRNISLIRYKKFGEDLLMFDQLNQNVVKPIASDFDNEPSIEGKKTNPKQKYRDYFDIYNSAGKERQELYAEIRDYILSLGDDITETQLKYYVAFKKIKNFVCAQVCRAAVVLHLKLEPSTVQMEKDFSKDVTDIGHWATGNVELDIKTKEDFEKAKPLIERAYKEN